MNLNVPQRLHLEVDVPNARARLRTDGWNVTAGLNDVPIDLTVIPTTGNVLAGAEEGTLLVVIELATVRTPPKPRVDPELIVPP